jgi:hypothetical protein
VTADDTHDACQPNEHGWHHYNIANKHIDKNEPRDEGGGKCNPNHVHINIQVRNRHLHAQWFRVLSSCLC